MAYKRHKSATFDRVAFRELYNRLIGLLDFEVSQSVSFELMSLAMGSS